MLKRLLINEMKDQYIQENFIRIQDFIKTAELLSSNFFFFSITVPGALTNYRFAHNLGFRPLDIIQTSAIGGTVTWNYSLFDDEFLDLTTSAALTVRGFAGRFDSEVKL